MNILHLNGMLYAALYADSEEEIITQFDLYVQQRTPHAMEPWSELTRKELIEGVQMLRQLVSRT